jgi:hypothetical protein
VSKARYFELIDEFCLLRGVEEPQLIVEGGALNVNDVMFSLLHNVQIDEGLLFIYADFGELPLGRELQASVALLEANLFLYSGAAPVFAISAETGRVVMAEHRMLDQLDAQDLSDVLTSMAAKARQWRSDYFLDHSSPFQLPQLSAPYR